VAKGKGAFYDTNVLVAFLFREEGGFETASKALKKHAARAISVISIHEIHAYCLKFSVEDRFTKLKNMLHKLFKITPLDQNACIKASHIRKTHKLPEVDALILATAVHGGFNHFYTFDRDYAELDGSKLEATVIHYLE